MDQGYGLVTRMTLPGGAQLDLYEPRHEMAIASAGGGLSGVISPAKLGHQSIVIVMPSDT